jgi:hypothetical protein
MRIGLVTGILCVLAAVGFAAEGGRYAGRSLDEVLAELQAGGLRIVYSSAVVRPEMTVIVEPEAVDPRGVLDEILAAHGLAARDAPGDTIVIVAARATREAPSDGAVGDPGEPGDPFDIETVFLGEVVVTPSHFKILEEEPETRQFLSRTEVEQMPHLADDLYRAVKRLPGAAGGDYSAQFNVRGGEQEELLVMLDGVELYEPYHLKDFRGVFSIIDSTAVSGVDLLTGGYPVE